MSVHYFVGVGGGEKIGGGLKKAESGKIGAGSLR